MKYSPITALILLLLFTVTQLFGLLVTQQYMTQELPYSLEPPTLEAGWNITYVITGIVIVSAVFYLITRLKYEKFLRIWFSFAVIISMSVSLSTFIGDVMALVIAIVLTILRLSTRDYYVHNLTEILVYGGIVAIFMPLFDPLSNLILLIIISVYDFISVFITKHMVRLAKMQAQANLFSGLLIDHKGEKAILGGGDVAFSLLFASVLGSAFGMIYAYFTIYAVIASLAVLAVISKKDKFYPAMPFITGACALGYFIALI